MNADFICDEPDCQSENTIECRLHTMDDEDIIEHYCHDHCQENGYCYGCGEFWGGIESFDFGNGLCENCIYEEGNDFDDEECY